MSDEYKISTLFRGAGLILGGRIVKVGVLFLVQILLARLLGTAGYGDYVLVLAVVMIGTILGGAGLKLGLLRKLPVYEGEPDQARGIVWGGIGIGLIGGLTVGTVVFLLAGQFANDIFDNPSLALLLRIAGFAIPFSVLTEVGLSIARSSRDAKPQFVIKQLSEPIGKLVFGVGLVTVGYETFGAVVGIALTFVLTTTVAMRMAYSSLTFDLSGATESMYRELAVFSLPLMISSGIFFLIRNTDTFLIGMYFPSDQIGIYNAAFQLRTMGMFFFHPFTFLLPPIMTKLQESDENGDAASVYQLVTKWMSLTTLPIFFGAMLFPSALIELSFGSKYTIATWPLQILLVSVFVTVVLGGNGQGLVALGHNRINLYVNACAATLNIVLNLFLIPNIGITGAAIATSVSFIFRDIGFSALLYRWEGIQPFSSAQIRTLALGSVAGLVIFATVSETLGTGFFAMVAFGVLFGLGMLPITYKVGLEIRDRKLIMQALSRAQDAV